MKFSYSNCKSIEDADIVFFGVPDETGSHSTRTGAKKAPDALRNISKKRDSFSRHHEHFLVQAQDHLIKKKIFDAGNKNKSDVPYFVEKVVSMNKIPICIGGDHSITFNALKGVSKVKNNLTLIYLDAHPDLIHDKGHYCGSVVDDFFNLKKIKKNIIEVGIRAPEKEEFKNSKKDKVKTYTSYDLTEKGVKNIMSEIKRRCKGAIYLSIDMDVLDPAFAPGVSYPVPAGMSPPELLYLFKNITALKNFIGFDIMEINPKYDIDFRTLDLASKLIIEYL